MARGLLVLALAACSNAATENRVDLGGAAAGDLAAPTVSAAPSPDKQVILFVWDGLRPDSISATDTPVLHAVLKNGVEFTDNHSTYPTFTMMNAAALATGSFPGTTGFYGNTLWAPGAAGKDSAAANVDFNQPAFTEDWSILSDLDAFYGNQLLLVGTLFQAAQAAGLTTAAVGKSGPAYLQDYKKGGLIVDEKIVWPLSLAQEIQAQDALPPTVVNLYPPGSLAIGTANGTPTASRPKVTLKDGVSSDPTDRLGAPTNGQNYYLMNLYLKYVLPKNPALTLIWFRAPDSPEHNYGPGSYDHHDALRAQDYLLGQLITALNESGQWLKTDLVIVSDHGHSSVSGPLDVFPLRAIASGAVGAPDPAGFSVSGDVRIADLLTRAGIANVFDGQGCIYAPEMSGHKGDGSYVYPTLVDTDGSKCGKGAGFKYTTPAMTVPATLPPHAVVVATNGGSDYVYVPDHDAATVQAVVRALQAREEVGAIFVHSRYGALPGTLPLGAPRLENAARSPDIVFSYSWDDTAIVQGVPGIEFESMSASNNRGMHGSFGRTDVHNTLVAHGPDFRAGFADPLPTANVDVAPTVAQLLGLSLPHADGRTLDEALRGGYDAAEYQVEEKLISSAPATGLSFQLPTDPTGATLDAGKSSFTVELHEKVLRFGQRTWTYFDDARGVRQ